MANGAYYRISDEEIGEGATPHGLCIRPASSDEQCEVVLVRPLGEQDFESDSLLRYVETALALAPPPQFILTINLFIDEHVNTPFPPHRTVNIALPKPTLPPTPYCRADDAPCLRNAKVMALNNLQPHHKLSLRWHLCNHAAPSVLLASPPYQRAQRNSRLCPATASACEQWYTRMARRLCPPWRALSESGNEAIEHCATNDGAPWPSKDNQKLAFNSIEDFLRLDRGDGVDKLFVCPASCHGWDMQRLEAEIKRDLQADRTNTGNILQRMFSDTPRYKGVRAYIHPSPPALAVRIQGNRGARIGSLSYIGLAYGTAWLTVLGCAAGLFAMHYGSSALLLTICLIALLGWTNYHVPRDYLFAVRVHDAVGVSWSLKRLTRLDYGIKTSEQALRMVPGATEAHQSDDGSWSVLQGIDEIDWWQQNKSIIMQAAREYRLGAPTSTLFPEERSAQRDFPPQAPLASPSSSSAHAPPPAYDVDDNI